jgi:predicted aldo/keto reductase-like oxidoreductase
MGKTGDKVSILGFGCMRFPRKQGRTDAARTERQVVLAIEQGVNYFDTAYLYPGSESALGKILARGYRDRVLIATKLPMIMVHSVKDMDAILDTQLRRLQTDRIDYYLMHAINSAAAWQRLKQLGVEEFLHKAKEAGKINRVGFSYHGDREQFREIVDDYPWDMCLLQYNYMDEHAQAGKEGLAYAAARGLGIAVMQPLRGGLLGKKMPPRAMKLFEQDGVKRTPAEWALRWVWNHPEVSVLLSGMNEEAQIEENIRIARTAAAGSLSAADLKFIAEAREHLAARLKVGCNECGYCLPCPAGVNIPLCFSYYNSKYIYDKSTLSSYLGMLGGMDGGVPSHASLCNNCGRCETKCPQNLPVQQHLKEVAAEMEPFFFRPVVRLVRAYYNLRKRLHGDGSFVT